jgi:hypothetical protein
VTPTEAHPPAAGESADTRLADLLERMLEIRLFEEEVQRLFTRNLAQRSVPGMSRRSRGISFGRTI